MFQLLRHSLQFPQDIFGIIIPNLFKALKTRLRLRYRGLYSINYYPKTVRGKRSLIKDADIKNVKATTALLLDFVNTDLDMKVKESKGFFLAGRYFDIDEMIDVYFSSRVLDLDCEQQNSFLRFQWLQQAIAKRIDLEQLEKINHLLLRCVKELYPQAQLAPYECSERICNLIVYKNYLKKVRYSGPLFMELDALLKRDIIFLLDHLEYPASENINNHILNNARAIFFFSCEFHLPALRELGLHLFQIHLPKMIGKDGVLKEGSSHYHSLLCRTVNEVFLLSKSVGDIEATSFFSKYSSRMNSFQNFMEEGLKEPLRIGDLSPDCCVHWFSIEHLCPWEVVWNKNKLENINHSLIKGVDGWSRINNEDWSAFTFSHPLDSSFPYAHGHDDFSSFSLFYKGIPIITDRGRLSYDKKVDDHSYSSRSHNGFESLSLISKGIFSCLSYRQRKELNFTCFPHQFYWSAKGLKRTLSLEKENVLLEDELGEDKIGAECQIFLSPIITDFYQNGQQLTLCGEFNGEKVRFFIMSSEEISCESVDTYPNYGEVVKCICLKWRARRKKTQVSFSIEEFE